MVRRIILLVLLAWLLAFGLLIPHAGSWLVVKDAFTHAEVAVVLSGLPTSRALAARDLYRQGMVERIWVIPEPVQKIEGEMVREDVFDELVDAHLVNPSAPQWAEQILVSRGVPAGRITVLANPAHGTINEAQLIRDTFLGHLPARLVIITSKSASRRARYIFRRVFQRDGVEVVSYPTPYDPFEASRWWSTPRNALTVVTEYEKLLINFVTLVLQRRSSVRVAP